MLQNGLKSSQRKHLMRRNPGQPNLDAHSFGHRVDRVPPCLLQILALGPKCRVRCRAKLKRHPLDFDIPALDSFLQGELPQEAEWANVTG